jgi:hypothetical protein
MQQVHPRYTQASQQACARAADVGEAIVVEPTRRVIVRAAIVCICVVAALAVRSSLATPAAAAASRAALSSLIAEAADPGDAEVLAGGLEAIELRYEHAQCVGNLLSASLWISNSVYKSLAISSSCASLNASSTSKDRATCSQSVFSFYRALGNIGSLLSLSAVACRPPNTTADAESPCAAAITRANEEVGAVGQYGSQIETSCAGVENGKYSSCGSAMEGFGWHFRGLSNAIASSVYECSEPYSNDSLLDPGTCVGDLVAATSYVAASGLVMTQAAQYDCPKSTVPEWAAACAVDVTSFARTMSLAASFANRAAADCAGNESECGDYISLAASAVSAFAQASTMIHQSCTSPDAHSIAVVANHAHESRSSSCAAAISTTIKELNVAAACILDAVSACGKTELASTQCGSSVTKTLAGMGYIAETASLSASDCLPIDQGGNYYNCGQDLQHMGDAVQKTVTAIGAAAINCAAAAKNGSAHWLTGPLRLNRRFFLPDS